ncbi:hypothetical protein V1527DRAFT_454154 [Lipomyces starkeyi]
MYTDIEQIRTKRKVDFNIFPVKETKATSYNCHHLMEHSDPFEVVKRPHFPDTRLEVPASWDEYKRVDEIHERDEAKYPQPWYDSVGCSVHFS